MLEMWCKWRQSQDCYNTSSFYYIVQVWILSSLKKNSLRYVMLHMYLNKSVNNYRVVNIYEKSKVPIDTGLFVR